ncbi:MAG TPA: 1,2-phenylacetyl-CoA epoxidase subunit PaaC [Candidatus Limnocylindria bacterium]|nr:1,2-phenylacetyl-CoA epoxidase subunit PaaC [Candidatus Limnocylindria bacterium]
MTGPARRPTRQLLAPDVPDFDRRQLPPNVRDALAGLLLAMADDEFVIGFWDSEWTGIAPLLEEDVAFSSLAQDEIGHARAWYEMLAVLAGETADRLAFGREPAQYRHARLLDHPRTDWAFSIARRWLYDTADSVRLGALARSAFEPLAEVVAKVRREERYHLMHVDVWLRRLAAHAGEPRQRLERALEVLAPDALTVFTPLPGEWLLVESGVMSETNEQLAERWRAEVGGLLEELGLPALPADRPPAGGRNGHADSESFSWLWGEFTAVHRLEEGVTW